MTTTPSIDHRSDSSAETPRRVLLLAHTGRDEAVVVAKEFASELTQHGLRVRVLAEDAEALGYDGDPPPGIEICAETEAAGNGCELAVVLGGDGTILRAAELTRDAGTPVLGVNLGHVGFLAEAEVEDVESAIEAIVAREYVAEERLTVDVQVYADGELIASTFALNEASVEKDARERMLEVVIEIDDRPVSRFGCDGVVCATPTGSTAYNFSAGGPVVWPDVEALLMVPICAHALFSRPMVVSPRSVLAVEIVDRSGETGVLWCDGRRTVPLPAGARIVIRRGATPVRVVRLRQQPFADRLVAKFDLPVAGWRGPTDRIRARVAGDQSDSPAEPSGGGEPAP